MSDDFHELFQNSDGIDGYFAADRYEFHDVNAPFASLILSNEGLRLGEPDGQFMLGEAGGFARIDH